MGIQGLLPLVKGALSDAHVEVFKGKTIAVDAYCWLHRGAYGCAMELSMGKTPQQLITYVQRRIDLLRTFGVSPFLVFDGQNLASKAGTDAERQRSRQAHRATAATFLRAGKKKEAHDHFRKSIEITPETAHDIIKLCQQQDVAYVVAPYEADAEMAYLYRTGKVQGIITEDSDLIAFGCSNIFFKMDPSGHGQLFQRQHLKDPGRDHPLNLFEWDDLSILRLCILSGCDYLPSIPGIGLKKAHQLLQANGKDVQMVLRYLRLQGQMVIPPDYLVLFKRAEHTFLYQRVYDAEQERCVPLQPFPSEDSDERLPIDTLNIFIGQPLADEVARGIAQGLIHPLTHKPMEFEAPKPAFTDIMQGLPKAIQVDTISTNGTQKPLRGPSQVTGTNSQTQKWKKLRQSPMGRGEFKWGDITSLFAARGSRTVPPSSANSLKSYKPVTPSPTQSPAISANTPLPTPPSTQSSVSSQESHTVEISRFFLKASTQNDEAADDEGIPKSDEENTREPAGQATLEAESNVKHGADWLTPPTSPCTRVDIRQQFSYRSTKRVKHVGLSRPRSTVKRTAHVANSRKALATHSASENCSRDIAMDTGSMLRAAFERNAANQKSKLAAKGEWPSS